MKKELLIYQVIVCYFMFTLHCTGQEVTNKSHDEILKETIALKYKSKIINYNVREFDTLFFEFFTKKNDPNLLLTKEEFYTYTVQIALYSDRLKALYPQQKSTADESKKKWMSERYEDYLLSKPNK